ncbi:MAG: two pore domain potassium channel family protein [Actinobacteria bacterium]|nr:two pore domain potassium channel family protein [Actinomycetota bacterium]
MAGDDQTPSWRRRRRGDPDRRLKREASDVRHFVRSLGAHDIDEAEDALRDLRHELRGEFLGSDSYVPVFVLTMLIVVLIPLSEGNIWLQLPLTFVATGTLLLALRRSHIRAARLRSLSILALVAGAMMLVASVAVHATGSTNRLFASITSILLGFLLFLSIPAMLRRVLTAPKVTLNVLSGALAAYLLLGLLFASAYRVIATATTDPETRQTTFFAQKAQPVSADFEYFSFITITTVGYGDLTPGNDGARAGAVAEAIMGQVFLVTIVARVVSNLGTERSAEQRRGAITESRRDASAPATDDSDDSDAGTMD